MQLKMFLAMIPCIRNPMTHIFLSEIDEVLQVDVVPIRPDVVVDEQIKLVFNPVLKHKGQNSCCQLQEKDDSQKHGELEQEENQELETVFQCLIMLLKEWNTQISAERCFPEELQCSQRSPE